MRCLWAAGGLALALAGPAWGQDLHIRSPVVEGGEVELEHNAFVGLGRKGSDYNGLQAYTYSLGYGVTRFWKLELEAETGARPTSNLAYTATTIESTFQLTPQGKYAADLGFFLQYSRSALRDVPHSVTFGPIVSKEVNDVWSRDVRLTLNAFVSRDIGRNASNDTGGVYAAQALLLTSPWINPGVELFGTVGNITRPGLYAQQTHSAGPVLTGGTRFAPLGKLKYEVGYQVGLTPSTARGGVRWKLEYEFWF